MDSKLKLAVELVLQTAILLAILLGDFSNNFYKVHTRIL